MSAPKGPAKVENLDAQLPEVEIEPAEPSKGKTRGGKISGRPTPAHAAVNLTRIRMKHKSLQQRKAQLYSTAATYDFVHDRLQFALGSDDPAAAVARLQQSLSLLTWELGETLKDIRAFETTDKEAKK